MTRLERWLERQARREAWRPTLDEALLCGRFAAYGAYRLRYFSARLALRVGLYLAEFLFFFQIVESMEIYVAVLVVRNLLSLARSLWWGGLEVLRARVRELAADEPWRRRTKRRIGAEIRRWLVRGSVVSGILLVAAVLIGRELDSGAAGLVIVEVYLLAGVVRFALELPVRTYHSGIFALRRIYVPLWVFALVDVVDVLGFLALWPLLGPQSFVHAFLAGGVLSAGLTAWLSRRAYRAWGIEVRRARPPAGAAAGAGADAIALLGFALANALRRLDSVLVVVLALSSEGARSETLGIAVLLHLMRPFLVAAHDWAQLFYFDLMRLRAHYARLFQRRFERLARATALAFPCLVFATGTAVCVAVYPGEIPWLTIALCGPFLLARSFLALFQVQAFAHRRFDYLAHTSAVMVAAIALVAWRQPSLELTLVTLTIFVALALSLVTPPSADDAPALPGVRRTRLLTLPEWIARVRRTPGSVRIARGRLAAEPGGDLRRLAASVAEQLPGASVCRAGRRGLLWTETSETPASAGVVAGGGRLAEVERTALGCGERVVALAHAAGWFGAGEDPALAAGDVEARFRARFPEGTCIAAAHGKLRVSPPLPRRALHRLVRSSMDVRKRAGAMDVSVYCPRGEPTLVFILDRTVCARARRAWRHEVEEASVAASLERA